MIRTLFSSMTPSFATSLDALGGWRAALGERVEALARFLGEQELAHGDAAEQISALRERLGNEKLVVAFVAEFSRGKSELINAIFFADTGRRILPATPGRTTMCPVELGWRGDEPASLLLLPIETRLEGLSLAEMRAQPRAWRRLALDIRDADQLAQSLLEVTRTEWVTEEQARALGFWDDSTPDDNPPRDDSGKVEVPAWRHALINYPHPLLKQGLVVLDTPGLNAIGAEPELTLSLLPSAHATVFILGADTGVTKSDLAIWRDHLGAHAPTRFVVLNKIDALEDPLATLEQVEAQISQQQRETARTLGIPIQRVFPLSARQALAARVGGDEMGLNESRLPLLEAALGAQLLPQRRQVLEQVVQEAAQRIEGYVGRHIGDARRQLAEQTLELRGLRGKNGSKVKLMLKRVEAETAEFEQCTTLLQAMRSVHARMLKDMLVDLSSDRLRDEVAEMQASMGSAFLNLGARKAFIALCARLRALLTHGQQRNNEIREMLTASFARLNAEFGFSLAIGKPLEFDRFANELQLIESNYVQYLGLTLGAAPGAAEVHGAVPAHAGLQAARRVREREQRARALEQGGLGAGRRPAARAPQRLQAAPRDAREGADSGRRARDAHQRDRDPGPAPAAVSAAHRRACRSAARARLRGAAGDRRRAGQARPAAVRRRSPGRGDGAAPGLIRGRGRLAR